MKYDVGNNPVPVIAPKCVVRTYDPEYIKFVFIVFITADSGITHYLQPSLICLPFFVMLCFVMHCWPSLALVGFLTLIWHDGAHW